jgi:hypothetical protein
LNAQASRTAFNRLTPSNRPTTSLKLISQ